MRRFSRYPNLLIGLALTLALTLVSVLAEPLSPYSPIAQHPRNLLQAPGGRYPLGTDELGRDQLSRLIHGANSSLKIAITAVTLAGALGIALGTIAGYVGGAGDTIIMRFAELLFAFPALLLALTIVSALGPGTLNTIIAIGLVYMPIFARVARAAVLAQKSLEFVQAAVSTGAGHARIILRHILPNALAPLIVQTSLALAWALLTEASLSFLGLGAQPPDPSWGAMLADSRGLIEDAPWLAIAPGVTIMLSVLGFNLLGDGLRDWLDPRTAV